MSLDDKTIKRMKKQTARQAIINYAGELHAALYALEDGTSNAYDVVARVVDLVDELDNLIELLKQEEKEDEERQEKEKGTVELPDDLALTFLSQKQEPDKDGKAKIYNLLGERVDGRK